MAGAPRQKKRQTQKRMKQKQKKQQRRKKRQQRNGPTSQAKCPSKEFVPKMLQNLCNGKGPLPRKAKGKAIFTQRYVLTTQDGQQQCFLSNYMSSEATTGASSVPPAIVWPYKLPVKQWPVTMCPQLQSSLANQQWQDGQQRCIISNAVPSATISGRRGGTHGTITTKDVQYEVNEMVPRQIPCFFTRDPNTPPF